MKRRTYIWLYDAKGNVTFEGEHELPNQLGGQLPNVLIRAGVTYVVDVDADRTIHTIGGIIAREAFVYQMYG